MFKKLKEKWGVDWIKFTLIFITFALGGSLCAKVGNFLLSYIVEEKSTIYWILYIPMLTILWPVCVLTMSLLTGQFVFFKSYLTKIFRRFKS
jgi:hypothetical protein